MRVMRIRTAPPFRACLTNWKYLASSHRSVVVSLGIEPRSLGLHPSACAMSAWTPCESSDVSHQSSAARRDLPQLKTEDCLTFRCRPSGWAPPCYGDVWGFESSRRSNRCRPRTAGFGRSSIGTHGVMAQPAGQRSCTPKAGGSNPPDSTQTVNGRQSTVFSR